MSRDDEEEEDRKGPLRDGKVDEENEGEAYKGTQVLCKLEQEKLEPRAEKRWRRNRRVDLGNILATTQSNDTADSSSGQIAFSPGLIRISQVHVPTCRHQLLVE